MFRVTTFERLIKKYSAYFKRSYIDDVLMLNDHEVPLDEFEAAEKCWEPDSVQCIGFMYPPFD